MYALFFFSGDNRIRCTKRKINLSLDCRLIGGHEVLSSHYQDMYVVRMLFFVYIHTAVARGATNGILHRNWS